MDSLEKRGKKDRKGWHFWQTTEEARLLLCEEMNRTQQTRLLLSRPPLDLSPGMVEEHHPL